MLLGFFIGFMNKKYYTQIQEIKGYLNFSEVYRQAKKTITVCHR